MKNLKSLKVMGLMSGTSMDGINSTIIETNGRSINRVNFSKIFEYRQTTLNLLKECNSNVSLFYFQDLYFQYK